jgi:AcrR family transcriptional regulator
MTTRTDTAPGHPDRAGRTGAGRPGAGRVNQKARTRAAIVRAVQDLARAGEEITMPSVARAALVSEATAYRYFPDLVSLLLEADAGGWPDPAEALAPVAASDDPVERVGYATEVLLTGILSRQSAVRAMIAASINRPDLAATRPGHRFALIDQALAPAADADPQLLAQLKQGLAVVMSAEALFVLTDLCGLPPRDAVASAVRTARSLTAATLRAHQPQHRPHGRRSATPSLPSQWALPGPARRLPGPGR